MHLEWRPPAFTVRYTGVKFKTRPFVPLCSARVDYERILSYFISTDHAVNHEPDAVSSFASSPGSAFEFNSGPNLDFDSVRNLHNTRTAPHSWTYNESFHLLADQ
ncbi:hypothetical protein EVAR_57894_1 [Eumeta japonica]|uniref:Uncharacterized protein n=1 Tax=Eumeta variegata TaxID=151549 RepID=A0A4C1YVD6_EUMVA|nr:hypothetical protein EVAR_57894_1 [Eumeta japonica]